MPLTLSLTPLITTRSRVTTVISPNGQMTKRLMSFKRPFFQRIPSLNSSIKTLAQLADPPSKSSATSFSSSGEVSLHSTSTSLPKLLSRLCETKSLGPGFQYHALITKSGLSSDSALRNHLINLYSKCRVFGYARNLLDEIPLPDLAAWSALISGYAQNGQGKEALVAFHEMRSLGLMCNEFTFPSVLKACAVREDLRCGKQIHGVVLLSGFDSDVFVANALVVMYAKCGEFVNSRRLFDETLERNVVSWNALFSCYLKGGYCQEALYLFGEMVSSGVEPNEFSLSSVLSAASGLGDGILGRKIHGYLIKLGYEEEQFSANVLVDMYTKVGDLEGSLIAFQQMVQPDTVSWNAVIAGCVLHEDHDLALELFDDMKDSGVLPNFFTLSSVLKACAMTHHLDLGRQLHSSLLKMGMKEDLYAGIGLIDMYFKCSSVEDAQKVFRTMPEKDLIVWNAMISGQCQNGNDEEALKVFSKMYNEGVGVNQTSLSTTLKSSASLRDKDTCRQIHSVAIKSGLQSDDYVINSLVDTYGKCSSIEDASKIFMDCQTADMASLTSMITAYSQCGQGEEALKLFLKMQQTGLLPDQFVCSSLFNVCAGLSAYEQGKQVHANVLKLGYTSDIFAGNSLVNMYAKCGCIEDATRSFSLIRERGIVSWSAMIGGLAQHGHGKEAMEMFDQMLKEGISPNQVTLVSALCACNHAGLIDQAKHYFNSMQDKFGIKPTQEHYSCMIDLLGRAGKLDEAVELLDTMPYEANASIWGALLAAARIHKNVGLGERAAKMLYTLEPEKSGTHVLLANIYASAGEWENVSEVRRLMKESEVKKEPGMSWMEMKGKVHTFVVGDRTHPRSKEIYAKLKELWSRMSKAGYVPLVETDLHDVGQDEKEILLSHHSEKLAVAFGLIAKPPGAPIMVKKNLRICLDCHTAFKFICKLENREIIVRDNNRYHHFRDGSCSCGDYW